jgi:hypothetical protein
LQRVKALRDDLGFGAVRVGQVLDAWHAQNFRASESRHIELQWPEFHAKLCVNHQINHCECPTPLLPSIALI